MSSRDYSTSSYQHGQVDSIIDRLESLMTAYGLNNNSLTVRAGLSVGLLGQARKSRKGLHSDTIQKILNTMPEVSVEWFVMGRGTMHGKGVPDALEKSLGAKRAMERAIPDWVRKHGETLREIAEERERKKRK